MIQATRSKRWPCVRAVVANFRDAMLAATYQFFTGDIVGIRAEHPGYRTGWRLGVVFARICKWNIVCVCVCVCVCSSKRELQVSYLMATGCYLCEDVRLRYCVCGCGCLSKRAPQVSQPHQIDVNISTVQSANLARVANGMPRSFDNINSSKPSKLSKDTSKHQSI